MVLASVAMATITKGFASLIDVSKYAPRLDLQLQILETLYRKPAQTSHVKFVFYDYLKLLK